MKFAILVFIIIVFSASYAQEVITIKPNGDTLRYSDIDLRSHLDQHTDGKRILFNNKRMVSLVEIKNGNLNGYSIQFYPSGKTKSIGNFIKGEKKGKWLYFDKNGRYLREENW